jgi:hypothetical protein
LIVESEVPIAGRDDANDAFKQFQAIYGAPAYVRRARSVEAAYDLLLERCRRQREEWLPMVRMRLGTLHALAGEWEKLRPLVAELDLERLRELYAQLSPRLRVPVEPTTSSRLMRNTLAELRESLELFNRRWSSYLAMIDLKEINELRDGYNRYYVLEKECAVRSARLAREGFTRLEPLTTADLFRLLPLLPVPNLAVTR